MAELKVASLFELEKVLQGRSNKLFYSKSEADAYIRKLDNHHKYKRCVKIAERCFESREYWRYRYGDWNDKGYDRTYKWRKVEFWGSWGRRWLELAKKYKE